MFERCEPRCFQFHSPTRTCLTVLLISPLWSRLCSCGKRTWHISCLVTAVICSHARCSICTGSRLNVNWMSYFCPFTYGMLERKRKSDTSFMFVIVARDTSSQNVRAASIGLSPHWKSIIMYFHLSQMGKTTTPLTVYTKWHLMATLASSCRWPVKPKGLVTILLCSW